MSLAGALAIMSLASGANTAIPLCLGKLIDSVNPDEHSNRSIAELSRTAALYLAFIGAGYLVREVMNVLRRFLVNDTCTRIDRDMYVRIVSHLLKVDLGILARDQVGALYGRITRGVDGLVRFLRVGFLDFVPALFMGTFALSATLVKQPRIALAMAGVIPVSLGLTIWQLITQKGIRLDLLASREAMDGTVVEQLGGIDYIRAANTDRQEVERVERAAEYRRAKEVRHHFEMSLFGSGKAINEGFFHLVVLAFAIYLFVHGEIKAGDIIMFSVLYLNVMAPLNEIHRFIDETHESSLRVADLLSLLAEPLDRSFELSAAGEPRLVVGDPVFVTNQLCVEYRDADGVPKPALEWSNEPHPAWRDNRRRRSIRLWQDDMVADNDAPHSSECGLCDRGWCGAIITFASVNRQSGGVRWSKPVRLCGYDCRKHRVRMRRFNRRSNSSRS